MMDENDKFSCEYTKFETYYPINMENFKRAQVPIEDMIEKSNYIFQIFIKFMFENDTPFINQDMPILIVYKYKK